MMIRRLIIHSLVVFALLLQTARLASAQSTSSSNASATMSGDQRVVPINRERINLLAPIQHIISGPGWLLSQGIDIRPTGEFEMDRFNPYLGRGIENLISQPFSGLGAPAMQGGAGVLVPYRDPAPAFSRNLLMSRDYSERTLQTEPDLDVNPLDPDHIVVGTIDYNFPSNSAYVSIDGGQSWTGPIQTKYLRDDLAGAGDPVVKFDSKGNVYMASISLGFDEYKIGIATGETLVSSIAVAASVDGGFTWADPVSTSRSGVEFVPANEEQGGAMDEFGRPRGQLKVSFLDKPWMAIGPHPTIEDQDIIYVTYVKFTTVYDILYLGELPVLGAPVTQSTPELVSSTDGGQTWSEPVAVGPTVQRLPGAEEGGQEAESESEEGSAAESQKERTEQALAQLNQGVGERQLLQGYQQLQEPEGGEAEGERRVLQGVTPAVDSKGNVFVYWIDSTDDDSQKGLGEFYMTKSEDAGVNWSKPKKIASFLETPFRPRNSFFRYWASIFPKVAVGPKDEMYIVWTALPPENPLDEGDVYMIRSTDGGNKWSRPKRLNTDETNAAQFFPAVDVAPDGTVHVMWGDMRDDKVETRYHIYYTTSSDQGETWGFKNEELGLDVGDTRVTDFPTNPNRAFPSGLFIGDYFAIAATNKDAYMVWADGRLGEYGGVNQKIAFARKRQVPSPEIFVSPNTGAGGETVTVQGFGFQPDITYYLRVAGTTVANGRTDGNGEMTASVFMPISGEGAHPVALVDDSGNVASTTFYMEFGFDNIKSNLEALDEELDLLRATEVTTASVNSTGGATQQVRYVQSAQSADQQQLASLEAQVQRLAAKLDTKQAETPAVAAAGGVAANSPLALGLAALAGILLGAALTRLRLGKPTQS